MKHYNVWIEVEEYDDKTDLYSTVEGLEFPASATFDNASVARGFASILDKVARAINPEAFAEGWKANENLKFEREWERKHHHANKKR